MQQVPGTAIPPLRKRNVSSTGSVLAGVCAPINAWKETSTPSAGSVPSLAPPGQVKIPALVPETRPTPEVVKVVSGPQKLPVIAREEEGVGANR